MAALANEVLKIKLEPKGNPAVKKLQKAIMDAKDFKLMSMSFSGMENTSKWKWKRGSKLKKNKSRYPLVNPNIEWQDRYFKNKAWLRSQIDHNDDEDLMAKLENLQPLILGKFCIGDASDRRGDLKWTLEGVVMNSCQHDGDRWEKCL